jgi:glycosyltransferase involved in cell wall biosynthesis
MLLSIITPYYKTLEYTKRLAKVLEPQLTDDIEWIIVDDGCNEKSLDSLKAKVIHLPTNSNGASRPRNVGLDIATGKYITFIDSDDYVLDNYIEKILSHLG